MKLDPTAVALVYRFPCGDDRSWTTTEMATMEGTGNFVGALPMLSASSTIIYHAINHHEPLNPLTANHHPLPSTTSITKHNKAFHQAMTKTNVTVMNRHPRWVQLMGPLGSRTAAHLESKTL